MNSIDKLSEIFARFPGIGPRQAKRFVYFILGGVVPILEKEPEKRIRIKDLEFRIQEGKKKGLKEIILAMNANLDGENTAEFIKQKYHGSTLTFSTLGRGLSTGAELEYADPETLKNAFLHRTK